MITINRTLLSDPQSLIARQLTECQPRILSQDNGEEVHQEVSHRCLRNASSRDWNKCQHGFIFTVAKRVAIDLHRREQSRQSLLSNLTPKYAHSSSDPVETSCIQEGHQRLHLQIKTLPQEQKRVIRAIFFEGLTPTQVAKALQIPLSTVKSRKRLALRRLRAAHNLDAYSDCSFSQRPHS